jgi:hypothetical protein
LIEDDLGRSVAMDVARTQIPPMDQGSSIVSPEPRCVAFVLIGDIVALDLAGPLEAFTVPRAHPSMIGRDPYKTWILSERAVHSPRGVDFRSRRNRWGRWTVR